MQSKKDIENTLNQSEQALFKNAIQIGDKVFWECPNNEEILEGEVVQIDLPNAVVRDDSNFIEHTLPICTLQEISRGILQDMEAEQNL